MCVTQAGVASLAYLSVTVRTLLVPLLKLMHTLSDAMADLSRPTGQYDL